MEPETLGKDDIERAVRGEALSQKPVGAKVPLELIDTESKGILPPQPLDAPPLADEHIITGELCKAIYALSVTNLVLLPADGFEHELKC